MHTSSSRRLTQCISSVRGINLEPSARIQNSFSRSLMRQASALPGGPPLHAKLIEGFHKRSSAGEVSGEEATNIIIDAIKDRPLTFIIVDALDECDRQERDTLVSSLEMILARSTSLVKIFVTSRENHHDITSLMIDYPALCIDASRNEVDINS